MELNGELLVAAHTEWMNQLCIRVVPLFVEGLKDMRNEAKGKSGSKSKAAIDRETVDILKAIPQWNQHLVQDRTSKIVAKVPKLQNYVTIIFMIKSKIMSCMAPRGLDVEIELEMLKDTEFVHGVYRKIATLLETRMHLFGTLEDCTQDHTDVPDVSVMHSMLTRCVDLAISMEVPADDISQTFLGNTSDISVKYKATPLATPAAPMDEPVTQKVMHTPKTPGHIKKRDTAVENIQDDEADFFTPRSETTKKSAKTEATTTNEEDLDESDAEGDGESDGGEEDPETGDESLLTTSDDESAEATDDEEEDTKTITISDVVVERKKK